MAGHNIFVHDLIIKCSSINPTAAPHGATEYVCRVIVIYDTRSAVVLVSCPDPTLCEEKNNDTTKERNLGVPIKSQLCQSHVTIITRQVYVCCEIY